MILDRLEHWEDYAADSRLRAAFEFLERAVREDLPVGNYEIDGKQVYAFVQEYTGAESGEIFEAHHNYTDIQMILRGKEDMEVTVEGECTLHTPYSPEKDVVFYTCKGISSALTVDSGSFALFFPWDLHKPGLRHGNCPSVKKVVVKVHV